MKWSYLVFIILLINYIPYHKWKTFIPLSLLMVGGSGEVGYIKKGLKERLKTRNMNSGIFMRYYIKQTRYFILCESEITAVLICNKKIV